jgi:hypothetical protein
VHASFFALTRAYNQKKADALGWGFVADSEQRVPNENPWRERAAIIASVVAGLAVGDEVLWVDGDCLIVGDAIGDIFNEIANADYGMIKSDGIWNAGVIAMRVSPQVRTLWVEMRDHKHNNEDRVDEVVSAWPTPDKVCETWDANECASCPWEPSARGPLCGSHKVRLVEIDRKWNSLPDEVDARTQIIGFHHNDAFTKLRLIMKILEAR